MKCIISILLLVGGLVSCTPDIVEQIGHTDANVTTIHQVRTKKFQKGKSSYSAAEVAPTSVKEIEGLNSSEKCPLKAVFGKVDSLRMSCLEVNFGGVGQSKLGHDGLAILLDATGWSKSVLDTPPREFNNILIETSVRRYIGPETEGRLGLPIYEYECRPKLEIVEIPSSFAFYSKRLPIDIHSRASEGISYLYLFYFHPHPECYGGSKL